jgi:hypothetical protein
VVGLEQMLKAALENLGSVQKFQCCRDGRWEIAVAVAVESFLQAPMPLKPNSLPPMAVAC